MSGWYFMDEDPALGVRRWGLDVEDGTIIRTEYYAANAFMEANLAQRNEDDSHNKSGYRHVASIPMHIWAKEIVPRERDGNQASIKRWLNNSDNLPYRTSTKRV